MIADDTDSPDGKPCCNDDESCEIDHSLDEAYTEEIPCCNSHGKIQEPIKTEDTKKETHAQQKKRMDGYWKMSDWENRSRALLEEVLDVLESGESLGYFDSLIDFGTNLALTSMARNKYVDLYNKYWSGETKFNYTEGDIDKQNKGGYDVEMQERLIKLLATKNEKQICPRCDNEMSDVYGNDNGDNGYTTGYLCKKCGTEKEIKVSWKEIEHSFSLSEEETIKSGGSSQ